jgi:uncharacterized protein (TIGR02271 family)
MDRKEQHEVFGKDGLHGKIVYTGQKDEALGAQVLVQFDDGPQALVPADALVRREDGSFYLPIGREDLDRQPNVRRVKAQEAETLVLPVVEEELHVGKRKVATGVVRVRKIVGEREELVDEVLVREVVDVARVPINTVVEGPIEPRNQGDTLIIPLLEEVLVVEKRLLLREELHITLRREARHEPQHVTLRREEVEVERLDPSGQPTNQPADQQRAVHE